MTQPSHVKPKNRETDWRLLMRLAAYGVRSGHLLTISLLLLIPLAVSGAVQPIVIGQAISLIRGEETYWFLKGLSLSQGLNILTFLLGITITIRLSLLSLQGYLVTKVGQRITADIRNDLFDHVLSLAVRFFDRTPVGRLITRLTSDVEALGDVFSTGAIGIIGDLFSLIVIAIFMFFIQWQLASMLSLMLVPVTALIIYFQNQYRQANYVTREELSTLNSQLQENLVGIGVVQLFRREKFNAELFRTTNKHYIKQVDLTIFYDSAISATLEWVSLVAIAAVLWFGGQQLLQKNLDFGTLSAFILFAQRLFDPLRQFAEKFTAIQSGFTAVERVSDLLNEPIEILDRETREYRHQLELEKEAKLRANRPVQMLPITAHPDVINYEPPVLSKLEIKHRPKFISQQLSTQNTGEIIFENVWFAYKPGEYVIKDLNFTISPGEKVALVGPTGAGKSSIIRLLCRLYEPTQGRIIIDNIDIRDLPQSELRRHIGVILQDSFLFSGDVKSNITLGENYPFAEIRSAAEKTNVANLIEQLPHGYDTQLRERGTNLSGGQKQLLAFARVAIRGPRILILDEATASLDVGTEALIQEALEELLIDRTAIIIAHRLSTIRNSDRILVLKKGELVESGTHDQLLQKEGLYASLYKLQKLGT